MTFITLEGIDGSGKTSVVEKLQDEWREKEEIVFTSEPYKMDRLYDSLDEEELNYSEVSKLFFFVLDHSIHVDNFLSPNLQNGNSIICDRYIDSRMAYQAASIDDFDMEYISKIHDWSIEPSLTLLLDIPVEVSKNRISHDDSFEREELLRDVRENYLKLAKRNEERYIIIDADRDFKDVILECRSVIKDEIEEL